MGPLSQLRYALALFLLALMTDACVGPGKVTGLQPLFPEVSTGWSNLDSLQPTFRWEAFPRPAELENEGDELTKQFRSVTYDLRIWQGNSLRPTELVYERRGLVIPEHKLEVPLTAASAYFWTIRARFEIDGNPRVLEWSARQRVAGATGEGRRSSVVPSPFFHRFKTPAAE